MRIPVNRSSLVKAVVGDFERCHLFYHLLSLKRESAVLRGGIKLPHLTNRQLTLLHETLGDAIRSLSEACSIVDPTANRN